MRGTTRPRAVLVLLTVLISGLVSQSFASAATNTNGAFNVVISPISQNLEVKPGASVSGTIQLKNQGIATEHIKITVMSFGAKGQNGTPDLVKPGPTTPFLSWMSFPATTFDAEPGVWTPVKYTINPPKTAAFGYYYAIVFSRDKDASANKTINQVGAVASLVLLDVQAPGAVRQSDITQFGVDHNVTEFLPVNFSVRMHNTGNVHVAPRGNIFISKGGKNIALIEVNQGEGNVLPKSYRVFTAQWTDGTPSYKEKTANGKVVLDSHGNAVTNLDWTNFRASKLRFGKYTAKLVMVYNNGENDVATQAQLSFWVIPWRILAVVLIVLIVLVAGLYSLVIRPLRRRTQGRGNARRP